jgi:hypothetical protein
MHLKVAGIDSAELGVQTVLMYRLTYLLTLSDPHLLIERKLIAHLVVTALLRCGVGM